MTLIEINGYTVPTENITQYDVDFRKVYGAEEELENGYTYTEQTRAGIPFIKLACDNVSEADAAAIVAAVSAGQFAVKYYYGGMKSATMRATKAPALRLKSAVDGARFGISLELEG